MNKYLNNNYTRVLKEEVPPGWEVSAGPGVTWVARVEVEPGEVYVNVTTSPFGQMMLQIPGFKTIPTLSGPAEQSMKDILGGPTVKKSRPLVDEDKVIQAINALKKETSLLRKLATRHRLGTN